MKDDGSARCTVTVDDWDRLFLSAFCGRLAWQKKGVTVMADFLRKYDELY
jgi:hypothetical protein